MEDIKTFISQETSGGETPKESEEKEEEKEEEEKTE